MRTTSQPGRKMSPYVKSGVQRRRKARMTMRQHQVSFFTSRSSSAYLYHTQLNPMESTYRTSSPMFHHRPKDSGRRLQRKRRRKRHERRRPQPKRRRRKRRKRRPIPKAKGRRERPQRTHHPRLSQRLAAVHQRQRTTIRLHQCSPRLPLSSHRLHLESPVTVGPKTTPRLLPPTAVVPWD